MARAIKVRRIPGLLVFILLGAVSWLSAVRSASAFEAPTTITVEMHWLHPSGLIKDTLCSSGSQNWGCTAYCTDYPDGPCHTTESTKSIFLSLESGHGHGRDRRYCPHQSLFSGRRPTRIRARCHSSHGRSSPGHCRPYLCLLAYRTTNQGYHFRAD